MTIEPTNLTAQLQHRAAGNPPSTLPDSAISNCYPGLEFDFRNIWRRLLEGIELHESSGFVVGADQAHAELAGQYLLEVAGHPTRMTVVAPAAQGGQPAGQVFMEWSNALAEVVANHSGELVRCGFAATPNAPQATRSADLRVRRLFVQSAATQSSTALIDEVIARPGELTQSLCSPWQNDYQECACFYWAASRPDYVNVESTTEGTIGNKWLSSAPLQPKSYDVDDITHEELFANWEGLLRFVIGGAYPDGP